ncbi:MAG: ATPase, partial [Gemmatimonadota bacterium]|nr:ATPase [Gemmatimonadota bacterium]
FDTSELDWNAVVGAAEGLSQAELTRAAHEAAKTAVLEGHTQISTNDLLAAIAERRQASR